MRFLILLCLSVTFRAGAQTTSSNNDSFKICLDNLCSRIELRDTKIGQIRLPSPGKKFTPSSYYQVNRKTATRHAVTQDLFVRDLENYPFEVFSQELPRYRRKEVLDSLIRQHSDAYSEVNSFMNLLGIKDGFCNQDSLLYKLEKIDDYRAVAFLLDGFDNYLYFDVLKKHGGEKYKGNTPFINGLVRNRKTLTEHTDFLLKKNYFNYSQSTSKPKLIKGMSIYHDNDVFMPFLNEDKYYTGGGRLEFYTDFLKLNFIQNLLYKNYGRVTYQSVFLEVNAFTPYIRYLPIEVDPVNGIDTMQRRILYENDRPFASYEFFGVSTYGLHHSGKIRSKIQYRFGQIGGERSNNVQSILHRDQTVKSIKVLGWKNQIAAGGRLAFNVDLSFDWMLFSSGSDIFDKNKEKAERERKRNLRRHIHGSASLYLGNFLTAAQVGLGISNLNFKERDQSNNFRALPGRKASWLFYGNLGLRYVHHNPSLEGFGFAKTQIPDPTETLPPNNHVIAKENVSRILGIADVGVGLRVNQATLFYKLTLHTREIKQPTSDFVYGWGTIGMSFTNLSLFDKRN